MNKPLGFVVVITFFIIVPQFVISETHDVKDGYYILFSQSNGVLVDDERQIGSAEPVGIQDDGTYKMLKVKTDLLGMLGARPVGMDDDGNIVWISDKLLQDGDSDDAQMVSTMWMNRQWFLEATDAGLDVIGEGRTYDLADDPPTYSNYK